MSSAYFCSYYVAVCPYQFSASSKEVFLIAYKGTIFFQLRCISYEKKIPLVFLLIFVCMVVGFVLQNHIIDIVDKPTYGSNLPQGNSLDLINKVKPKSVH